MLNACPRSSARLAAIVLLPAVLAGCATTSARNPADPFEPFNRGVYQFNETLDRFVVKPVAQGYQFVLPQFVRTSVSNFFSNLNDVTVLVNNALQGKFLNAVDDFGRIAINTTIGVLGLFDIASEAGLKKNNEDFGQTLGVWGMPQGPFIMLPIFGPSTGRDTVGLVGDFYTDPLRSTDPVHLRYQAKGLRLVDTRAQLLDASKVLDAAALDPYEFLRDGYLQRRRNLIYDGRPPLDKDLDITPPRKSDTEARDRVAAARPAENLMAASEDHVPPGRLPRHEHAAGASRGQPVARTAPVAVEPVRTASPGPLFESDGTGASAASKAPASQAAGSGSSTLMRVLRYFQPRETPPWPAEGS